MTPKNEHTTRRGQSPLILVPSGANAFTAYARLVWKKLPPAGFKYDPWIRGELPPDRGAEITWAPPLPCTFVHLNIAAPACTYVVSVKVAGLETVDPRIPLEAAKFDPSEKPHILDISLKPGQLIQVQLTRTEPKPVGDLVR